MSQTLIESWLPFAAIGAESLRESGYGTPFPAPVRLHVWWARRPLMISRAAIVGSLLPDYTTIAADESLVNLFPTEQTYYAWFERFLGIRGDPVAARKLIRWAKEANITIKGGPYGGAPRAFTVNPEADDLALLERLIALRREEARGKTQEAGDAAGNHLASCILLDPFSGGGSIPFEGRRYGLSVAANELNPVAAVILKATLDYPARFGPDLAGDIKLWGRIWANKVQAKLAAYFPKQPGENIFAYLWARTVACPVTGKPVPLSPNWWLSKNPPLAVRPIVAQAFQPVPSAQTGKSVPLRPIVAQAFQPVSSAQTGKSVPLRPIVAQAFQPVPSAQTGKSVPLRFEIYTPGEGDDPDEGTVARGVGRSPWTGDAIDGDYIKAEAQAGRMGQMLYAVALKRRGGFDFRAPTEADLAAVAAAEAELARKRPLWEARDVIPTEMIPDGSKTPEPMRYGMRAWAEMFAPRQLLSQGTFVETLRELQSDLYAAMDEERARAIETYLGIMMDKMVIYNNRAGRFDPGRGLRSIFDRHDFAFVWSHGEFDASANLLPWAIDQVADAYGEMARLLAFAPAKLEQQTSAQPGTFNLIQGNAAHIADLADGSVDVIVTDPPYYDNVMYAELADFFYVWLKRTVGHLYPEWFAASLTDKDAEAVANPARFKDLTPGPSPKRRGGKEMAAQDYERKMGAAFREMARVLRPDGVLTVMFTHKQVEAWDTLASALINAGFTITASWPVHTESEHSLHQAQKNAAQSTILLVCRKREGERGGQGEGESVTPSLSHPLTPSPVWWDDLAPRVRAVAREKAAEFNAQGISGVDLYLSTFGPALAVISERWPVLTREVDEKTGQPRPLRPETALDLAREEVIALRKRGLLLGRDIAFDPVTDWYLMAWDAFQAERFPADEARKLALALGLDVERDLVAQRVISKSGSDVILQQPQQRRARGRVDPEAPAYSTWLDAVHTAMLVYGEDGAAACETFLKKTGLRGDSAFKAVVQAMLNAVPRAQVKGKFVRPEAAALESLRAAFFEDLVAPGVAEAGQEEMVQGRLV